MSGFFASAREAIADQIEKFRNRDFLEATMAASALVAMADGEVGLTEANIVDQALDAVQELKIYDPHEAIEIFRVQMDALKADPADAREEVLKAVQKVSGDDREAAILLKVCVAIAKSDETLTESERAAIGEIATSLGIDPASLTF